jgi:hypothetical protein
VVLENHLFDDDNGDGLYYPGEPMAVTLQVRNKGLGSTGTSVTATLTSSSPYATIVNGTHDFGVIPPATSADNTGNLLLVQLNSDTPYGETVSFDVDVAFDGYTLTLPLSVVCGVPRVLASFDMESDPGWTVGDTGDNATSGIWERDDPIGTYSGVDPIQPEDDHTPSPGVQCFVTGNNSTSAGGDDVDNGKTTLKTSILDLSSVTNPTISYWRWYCDLGSVPNNDIFQVDISDDGGANWVNVESLGQTENWWSKVTFQAEDYITPSSSVMMRFIAKDEPNDSLCEACIDDFEVQTYVPAVDLALSGTPSVGSSVNVFVDSPDDGGLQYRMAASTSTYPAVFYGDRYIPIQKDWLTNISLNPANPVFKNFSGFLDAAGQTSAPLINIPADPGLVGTEFFVVALTYNPPGTPSSLKNVSAPLSITVQ